MEDKQKKEEYNNTASEYYTRSDNKEEFFVKDKDDDNKKDNEKTNVSESSTGPENVPKIKNSSEKSIISEKDTVSEKDTSSKGSISSEISATSEKSPESEKLENLSEITEIISGNTDAILDNKEKAKNHNASGEGIEKTESSLIEKDRPVIYLKCSPISEQYYRQILEYIKNVNLPVGKVDEDYRGEISFPTVPNCPKSIELVEQRSSLSFFKKCGLNFSMTNNRLIIQGKPQLDYDGTILFIVSYTTLSNGAKPPKNNLIKETTTKEAQLEGVMRINPNPWSMWEEHSAPANELYQKSNEESEGVVLYIPNVNESAIVNIPPIPKKIAIAGSKRGRSHAHIGKFRDDHFIMKIDGESGWNYFAVADGAGSAIYSRRGSQLVCEEFIKSISKDFYDNAVHFDDLWKSRIADFSNRVKTCDIIREELCLDKYIQRAALAAYRRIAEEAKSQNSTIRDYHTTFLFAALKYLAGKWILLSFWVGDGGLLLYCPNGEENQILPLGKPDSGEFAGQTKFFTMKEESTELEAITKRVQLHFIDDFKALFLMSDGITDPYFPAEHDFLEPVYWNRFWNETMPEEFGDIFGENIPSRKAEALLNGLDFKVKGNHDDRTLLIVMNDNCPNPAAKSENHKGE